MRVHVSEVVPGDRQGPSEVTEVHEWADGGFTIRFMPSFGEPFSRTFDNNEYINVDRSITPRIVLDELESMCDANADPGNGRMRRRIQAVREKYGLV